MASQLVKLVLMMLSAKCVASYCFGGTKIATTNAITEYIYTYRNNQDCTISIQPSNLYSSGYYLEITWSTFDVKGDMPDCKNDYVEVQLTRYGMVVVVVIWFESILYINTYFQYPKGSDIINLC